MKIALYIEDGLEQIVLTPQSDTETALLKKLNSSVKMAVHRGGFYRCQGGWVRQSQDLDSTILVLEIVESASGCEG